MRGRFIGGVLVASAICAAFPAAGRAQEGGGFQVPGNTLDNLPIPTGGGPNSGGAGFYGAVEAIYLTQTRAIGDQTVAYHGLLDTTGRITQVPGTYIGSQQVALTTNNLGKTNFFPGMAMELGYKFDDGTRLYATYTHLFQSNYTDGATLATQYGRSNSSLTDTFLVSGVFNFSSQFAGPLQKTGFDLPIIQQVPTQIQIGVNLFFDPITGILVARIPVFATIFTPTVPLIGQFGFNPGGNTYGIWNGASEMTIKLSQRFTGSDIGVKSPLFETDYSRVYGLAGGRYAWFFERFTWITSDLDINGNGAPFYTAYYTNTLSQRMYGPFAGIGHEVYAGNSLSVSLDVTGSALLDIVKERAKYELGDRSTESKRGVNMFNVVPNANVNANVWWYPYPGVQLRVGYQAQTFFNTKYQREPIGFDAAAPDPAIDTKVFRIIHGINVGLGLFF